MPCGQYCYERKWQCQGGRLRQLTNVQKQPGPTRNYGSEGARENSIRRRVMSVKTTGNKTNYGPLFGGKKKPSVFGNCGYCGDRSVEEGKNVYYNNGGTSSTNTYWNKIAAGPKGVGGMTCCCPDGVYEQEVAIVWPDGVVPSPLNLYVGDTVQQMVAGTPTGTVTGWDGVSELNVSVDCKSTPFSVFMQEGEFGLVGVLFKINGGGAGLEFSANVAQVTPPHGPCAEKNRLCGGTGGATLLGGAPCSIGGKNWLNYRRFHPRGAKS